jgi:hypothetical protein
MINQKPLINQKDHLPTGQAGIVHILPMMLVLAVFGIIVFILISSTIPFKNGLLSTLFPKQFSRAAGNASITLPPSATTSQNSTFTVPVMIDTDGQDINGVDLRLNFNRYFLKVYDITPHPENSSLKTFAPFSSGVFDKTTVTNNANSTGIISLGALALNNGQPATFNGTLNSLVDITFQALNQGTTQINVSFTSGSTTDSNLVTPQNTDILNLVTNDTVTISGIGQSPSPTPSSTPTSSSSPINTPSSIPTATPSPSPTPRKTGDINGDNLVNVFDLSILLSNYGKTSGFNPTADLNADGVINIFDLSILLSNYGK